MTALEYLKEKARMSKKCIEDCCECQLFSKNNVKKVDCAVLEMEYPEEAVAIVQKWLDKHPQKTFLSDFLEKYPNAPMNERGFPDNFCHCDLGYTDVDEECMTPSLLDDHCYQCWTRPLEE